jgi:predicted metal-binding membrane protein
VIHSIQAEHAMEPAIETSALERVLRRDRTLTLFALLAAALLAWAFVVSGIGTDVDSMAMPDMVMPAVWTASYLTVMLAMWGMMMVAMMLPGAVPMVLLFATIERRRCAASPFPATAIFAAAYLLVWLGFSVAATLLQWQLDSLAQLSPALASTNTVFAAIVLIAAGIYQFTPLKRACLRGCRSPLEFISRYWGRGPFGIGLRHGLFCVGCCWMLMLVLFAVGTMNLLWVALIATFVLFEKVLPRGERLSYGAGVVLVGWGSWALYAHLIV